MAITAVHPQIARVELMAERNRLGWTIPDVGIERRAVIPDEADRSGAENPDDKKNGYWSLIGPFRKNLRQKEKPEFLIRSHC